MADTVFHKIISGEIPAQKEYEDNDCIVISDLYPKAPVHLLVIPKKSLENVGAMSQDDSALVGKLMYVAVQMAEKKNIKNAFRIVMNNGEYAGQTVMQMHIHVLGGWTEKPESDL